MEYWHDERDVERVFHGIPTFPRAHTARHDAVMKRSSLVYLATKGIARSVFPMFYRIETEGIEDFSAHGPAIILPKHQYWTDIPIVSLSFESLLHFVAKKELFKYPLIRQYLSFLGGIPLDRKYTLRTLGSFKILLALLKAGEKIVIFPEGTYFRNAVGIGKSRLVKMILEFQSELKQRIPFIPVGIRYGERVGWRRRVIICIGPPLFAEAGADATFFTNRVMDEISRLCQLPRDKSIYGIAHGAKCQEKSQTAKSNRARHPAPSRSPE